MKYSIDRTVNFARTNLAALLCLASLLLPIAAAAQPLRIAMGGEPETMDPHRYNLRLEETLLNDLFLGLTTFTAQGKIVPGTAERWTTSDDGLTWTFFLRKGLLWSDGTPITAQDFVYAYRRLQDPKTAASLAYFMHMVKNAAAVNSGAMAVNELGVRAVDDHTLEIRLEQPYPFLLERLLYPTAYPVPQHAIERHGDQWTKPGNWVSNGAYTLNDWVPRSHVEMRANPNFVEPVAIASIRYLPVTNEQSAYNRYRSGELDVIGSFPIGELPDVRKERPNELRLSNLLSMLYLVFNTRVAPFDDVRVRKALSIAVDQSIITDKVLKTGSEPAFSFVPDAIDNYEGFILPHADLTMSERVGRARELLSEAGYPDGFDMTLRHVSNLENKKVNLAIAGMWRAIGLNVQLQQADLRTHFGDLRQGNFSVAWAGWVGENNAEHYLSLLQSDIGSVNYGQFSNPTFDALMAQVRNEKDKKLRNRLLGSAEEVAAHFYPVVPLYSTAVRRLVHPALKGWHENGRDMHPSRYLSWRAPIQ